MQSALKHVLFVALALSAFSCATEQEKKVVGTWNLYCREDELEDGLENLKAGEMLTVKRKFTADNEAIEIFEDEKKKYSSMSPGTWKIEGNKLSISLFTYTMYEAEVFDIVQITDTTMTLAKGQESYRWCRDKKDE